MFYLDVLSCYSLGGIEDNHGNFYAISNIPRIRIKYLPKSNLQNKPSRVVFVSVNIVIICLVTYIVFWRELAMELNPSYLINGLRNFLEARGKGNGKVVPVLN